MLQNFFVSPLNSGIKALHMIFTECKVENLSTPKNNKNIFQIFFLNDLVIEGNLVKALNQCRLENMKKLIEPSFFLELSNIGDNFFHISLGLLLGLL